jgi:hypothetical protein
MTYPNRLSLVLLLGTAVAVAHGAEDPAFGKARESAEIAGYTISKVQRWTHPPKPSVNGLETFDTQSDFVPHKKALRRSRNLRAKVGRRKGQNLRLKKYCLYIGGGCQSSLLKQHRHATTRQLLPRAANLSCQPIAAGLNPQTRIAAKRQSSTPNLPVSS